MLDLTRLCATDSTAMARLDEVFAQNAVEQETLQKALNEFSQQQLNQAEKSTRLQDVLVLLSQSDDSLTEYSENTVRSLLEQVKVIDTDKLQIIFKGGMEQTLPFGE